MKKLEAVLNAELEQLKAEGRMKGKEDIIVAVRKASGNKGPRYLLRDHGDKEFIRMNSNSYLGLSLRDDMIAAEEEGTRNFGVGPGAVRFINGTFKAHRDLEHKLAAFHGREDAMIFSAAYVTVGGVITSLISKETAVISDELNHNSIINAIKLSRPCCKDIYKHNDMNDLKRALEAAVAKGAKRVMVVTDGIFSMRGDNAPLKEVVDITHSFDDKFAEGAFVVMDDSHGVGACGKTGRGTEEMTGARVDVLIGTLGKAYGVNGGYVCASRNVCTYLREHAPMYIYSNPITVGEAAATMKALEILDSEEGLKILEHIRAMTKKFEDGLKKLGYETIPGQHPVTPLVLRDTDRTHAMVNYLKDNGVLATGMAFPVVPKGDEEIRFQINGDHTESDIDTVLKIIAEFKD